MQPLAIPVPPAVEAMESAVAARWTTGNYDDIDPDDLTSH